MSSQQEIREARCPVPTIKLLKRNPSGIYDNEQLARLLVECRALLVDQYIPAGSATEDVAAYLLGNIARRYRAAELCTAPAARQVATRAVAEHLTQRQTK